MREGGKVTVFFLTERVKEADFFFTSAGEIFEHFEMLERLPGWWRTDNEWPILTSRMGNYGQSGQWGAKDIWPSSNRSQG